MCNDFFVKVRGTEAFLGLQVLHSLIPHATC